MKNNIAFYKKRWFRYGIVSIILIGFGVSLIGEAMTMKLSGMQVMEWIALATFALIALNAIFCTFGKSTLCKIDKIMDN
ncbi:MAG: hypothetical protein ACPGXZ_06855 [Saprospiraceae bacterium]